MARHGVSAAERRRIADELGRLSRASEAEVKRIVARLYERVNDLPPEEALRVLREAMPLAADDIAASIGRRFAAAAATGAGRAATGLGIGGGWREAAKRLTERYRQDGGIMLSRTIHGRSQELLRGVETAITSAMSNGRSALDLAQRLRDDVGSAPAAQLTKQLHDLRARAKAAMDATGSVRAGERFARTARSLDAYAAKLQRTAFGMGAQTEHTIDQIRAAVKRGNADAVDEALRWHVYHKQSYHQRVIARTEMARGYTEGFKANADVPWVVGFKWNVEKGPRKRDICDMYQGQNLYGLGPGVYPFDRVPTLPAHPNCQCWLEEWIDESVTEEDTRPSAPPQRTGATATWLRQQPAAVQREILGASGYGSFRTTEGREVPGWLRA